MASGTSDLARPESGTRETRISGLKTRWIRRGERRGEDLPILVLHGWGAHLEAIESIVLALEGETEVLALDLPGFGASEPPRETWGSEDYARFVLAFLDAQEIDRCHVVGHSFGGRVAVWLANLEPGRFGRLVLCDASGLRPRRGARYYWRVGLAKVGRAIGLLGPPGRRLQDRIRRGVASSDYLAAPESMRGTIRRVLGEDLSDQLSSVSLPVLLVWGEADEDTPLWMGHRMEELILDSGLVVLPGAGHYSYADSPGRFTQVSRHFLCHQPREVAKDSR